MKQQVKISKVKGNPSNPRIIKNDKFKKLVKSIQEFPEMLKLRPIVVDEDFMVLGGNMRLKASKDAGLKEVWIDIAEGLTEEQKKEFIVKDNVGFGEWEWDMLGNEWDSVQLAEWGLDVWGNIDDIETSDNFTLNNDDKAPYQQMAFTMADSQVEFIKTAIKTAKQKDSYNNINKFGNENGNGNALYLIASEWVEQKK